MAMVLQALGPEDQKGLDRLIAYAKANPLTIEQIKATQVGDRPPVGDYLEHQWVWPIGFRCVFSFEHHPMGLSRHLSVSVYDKSDPTPKIPSPSAMNRIGDAFGFKEGKLDYMWVDEKEKAINLIQKVED